MFDELIEINRRPGPFECYTASQLWDDEHTSKKMLEYHLNESVDIASRNIGFIDRSVQWMVRHFGLNPHSAVIDFGCGPGLYTSRLAKGGMKVTGIDFSRRSIHYARQSAKRDSLAIDYVHGDYLRCELPDHYDLITMIMCDFCALSPEQRRLLLNKFRDILKADGSILLDVYSLCSYDARDEIALCEFNQMSNFWSADDYYSFQNTFKYDGEKVILDKYTIIEKARTRVVYNWLQYYSMEALEREFRENGLEIVEAFSDVAGAKYREDSPEFAVVAKKAG